MSTTSVQLLEKQLDENANEIYYKPDFLTAPSYDNEDFLRERFPVLKNFNRERNLHEFSNANYYVIRSKKTDDIHKAVKYGVWTSSPQNNKKIEDAFYNKMHQNGSTLFFFTYINAPGFVGVARLIDLDLKREFPFWGEIGRWIGVMHLEWVFVRDVEFDSVMDLKEQAFDGTLRYMNDMTDGSRLSQHNAMKILERMNERKDMSFVFKKFLGHDHQEKSLRPNVDEIIRTNMMDVYKKKAQKKVDEPKGEAPKPVEQPEVVIKKKMTQGELKKLKKLQQQQKDTVE